MNMFIFLREKSPREKKDEKRQLSKMSKRQLSFLFCAVLWTKPRGLGGCIHHFRDLEYVNYRKYKNVNYCLGFVLG